jgi:hypothetical protein
MPWLTFTSMPGGLPGSVRGSVHSPSVGRWSVVSAVLSEAPRLFRRLQTLRGWSHRETRKVSGGGSGAGGVRLVVEEQGSRPSQWAAINVACREGRRHAPGPVARRVGDRGGPARGGVRRSVAESTSARSSQGGSAHPPGRQASVQVPRPAATSDPGGVSLAPRKSGRLYGSARGPERPPRVVRFSVTISVQFPLTISGRSPATSPSRAGTSCGSTPRWSSCTRARGAPAASRRARGELGRAGRVGVSGQELAGESPEGFRVLVQHRPEPPLRGHGRPYNSSSTSTGRNRNVLER